MRRLQTIRTSTLQRHVHTHSYAALVLSGCYEEAGDIGRLRVEAGDVVLHDAFEAHLDRFPASGATILNIILPAQCSFEQGAGRIDDPDSIVRMAETDAAEAAAMLVSAIEARKAETHDWPDELAIDLMEDPALSLSQWSIAKRIPPWSLSRGFAQVFGISPSAFRARVRTRRAWKAIQTTDTPLARIAAHCGFADQSHMTRSVRSVTGQCPRSWRVAANRFKTDPA